MSHSNPRHDLDRIDVFDTWATTHDGRQLHFDVLVAHADAARSEAFARQWLASIGIPEQALSVHLCRFCHSQTPSPEARELIARRGYAILQLEGCPSPDALATAAA